MSVGTILIVGAAHAANLSVVSGQMGYEQDFAQGRKLCAFDPAATWETPATHYFTNAQAMAPDTEQKFLLMEAGQFMPQVVWAETSITEVEANAAAAALTVISDAGETLIGDIHLLLQSFGLQFVPEAEI